MKIAIEPNLTPVKDYLTEKGHSVESVSFSKQSSENLQGYDAIVVTGLNSNFLGVHDAETKAVVINADGLTPEEVAGELDEISKTHDGFFYARVFESIMNQKSLFKKRWGCGSFCIPFLCD